MKECCDYWLNKILSRPRHLNALYRVCTKFCPECGNQLSVKEDDLFSNRLNFIMKEKAKLEADAKEFRIYEYLIGNIERKYSIKTPISDKDLQLVGYYFTEGKWVIGNVHVITHSDMKYDVRKLKNAELTTNKFAQIEIGNYKFYFSSILEPKYQQSDIISDKYLSHGCVPAKPDKSDIYNFIFVLNDAYGMVDDSIKILDQNKIFLLTCPCTAVPE